MGVCYTWGLLDKARAGSNVECMLYCMQDMVLECSNLPASAEDVETGDAGSEGSGPNGLARAALGIWNAQHRSSERWKRRGVQQAARLCRRNGAPPMGR